MKSGGWFESTGVRYCPSIEDTKSHGIIQSGTTLKIGGSQ
uniref:tRNA uridine 5-carboxymethylaminomethyl modification enzyme n=1 Tax=Siphoviridae sp. cttnq1 TaxID=2826495 RepID=A0A8S5QZQ7_9CAUD|nr:MAG TPA: tRNA uridine 5-carboxymethylaminomethyl modification enzyme [Siphoviridae sp. cttnq1]